MNYEEKVHEYFISDDLNQGIPYTEAVKIGGLRFQLNR